MITVVASDTGGYAVGALVGKHPMVPAISPKKSWEGLVGSLVFGITAAILMATFLAHTALEGCFAGLVLAPPARLAIWWNRRSSATSASRTWAGCCRVTAG